MEEVQIIVDEVNEMMDRAIQHVIVELTKIRAGKATPNMVDSVRVDYYGNQTPLSQMATVNTPDARTLIIRPWEKTFISEIEKAIINSDLGLNPQNDGEQIILNIPALTEERRITLVKQSKHEGEQGKISIRNARHEGLHHLKDLKNEGVSEDDIKRGEEKIQELTDQHTEQIDELVSRKEQEIMTV